MSAHSVAAPRSSAEVRNTSVAAGACSGALRGSVVTAQATVLGSTNLLAWQVLQVVPVTSGGAVFTDDTATNNPVRFYRIRVP